MKKLFKGVGAGATQSRLDPYIPPGLEKADTATPTRPVRKAAVVVAKPGTKMMKKGGAVKKTSSKMMDMEGRAMKRKTADAKGRAMKKTGVTGYGGVVAMGMKKGGKAAKKGK